MNPSTVNLVYSNRNLFDGIDEFIGFRAYAASKMPEESRQNYYSGKTLIPDSIGDKMYSKLFIKWLNQAGNFENKRIVAVILNCDVEALTISAKPIDPYDEKQMVREGLRCPPLKFDKSVFKHTDQEKIDLKELRKIKLSPRGNFKFQKDVNGVLLIHLTNVEGKKNFATTFHYTCKKSEIGSKVINRDGRLYYNPHGKEYPIGILKFRENKSGSTFEVMYHA